MYTTPLSTLISSLSLNHQLYADDTQLFLSFYPSNLDSSITHLQNALQAIFSWMSANLLNLNTSKTEFLLIGLKQQLAKINSCSLDTVHSARNLGFIFDEHLTFSDQISALSKSCYYLYICQLLCIHPYLDLKTASTIVTSVIHSKLDYCNSLYYSQLNRLQLIGNSLARAVVRAPKSFHITPSLRSLHWLKIKERIHYKIFSLTYKVLTTTEPSYLYDFISLQPLLSSRLSDVVSLARPPSYSSLKVNNCSFRHASLRLWNELPKEHRQPVDDESLSLSSHLSFTSSSSSPLSLCITPSLFH